MRYLICRKWRGGTHVESFRIRTSLEGVRAYVRDIDTSVPGNDHPYWFVYRVYPDREPEALTLNEMKEVGLR